MTEESVKCPICGTLNKKGSEACEMCRSRLSTKEDGQVKVRSPKSRGKTHIMIDIEDPLTRKKLEELTLIPGVTRKKALLLYQSGIHSMDDFLIKAFTGERFSANYSRTVANKLLVQSLKGKKNGKKAEIFCPSCKAPNPIACTTCKVCNFDLKEDMDSIDMQNISGQLTDSVKEILTNLSESKDFGSLPEDMKTQFAALIDSDDIDIDAQKPKELETLGIDLDNMDDDGPPLAKEQAQEDGKPEMAEEPMKPDGPIITKPSEGISDKEGAQEPIEPAVKLDAKMEKIHKILEEKYVKWRKAGYDVASLDSYLDDVEGFKAKAKEVLGNGKVVKIRYQKQIEMWKEKGFEVSELAEILEADVDLFPEKAKEILKKQKNK